MFEIRQLCEVLSERHFIGDIIYDWFILGETIILELKTVNLCNSEIRYWKLFKKWQSRQTIQLEFQTNLQFLSYQFS